MCWPPRAMILVVVVGQLQIPQENQKRWRELRLDAKRYDDWPGGTPLFTGESPGKHRTVGDVLAAAEALDGAPDFFELDGERVSALFTPDTTDALHQDLATALRLSLPGTGRACRTRPVHGTGRSSGGVSFGSGVSGRTTAARR